jgi:chemotaxis protein methyltransferase CheR
MHALAEHALAPSTGSSEPRPASARSSSGLALTLELLRAERFAEALERIRRLPPELADEPDVLLVQAVLLVHNGELLRAEPLCRHLLERGEHHSGAHYVLALCREGGSDARGAADHDQIAVALDPAFAMPRLHLGLLARREGNRAAASRELALALPLLEREDAARRLLFGGGFSREVLLDLCRSELRACGEWV